ncbi:MAG: PKD domain-containing protein [Bacteroidetes bacterium]|nr:PKD domain-containing protein [Bacteroidota bacterium]
MKKILLSLVITLVVSLGSMAQNAVHISGIVSNNTTNQPVQNHPVMIMADSSNPMLFSYYNTVFTDTNGYYEDFVAVPAGLQVLFTIYTFDCNQQIHVGYGMSTNAPLTVNFSICDQTNPCYNWITVTSQQLWAHFVGHTSGGTAPYTYFWDFGDGTSAITADPVHNYAQPGIYVVTLTTTDASGCTFISYFTITIGNVLPCDASFIVYPDSNALFSYHFIANGPANVYAYSWNFGDGGTSTAMDPHHAYNQAGTYLICLTVSDPATGCQDTWCDSLVVGTNPNPCHNWITWTVNTGFLGVAFIGHVANGTPPYTYLWNFGDGTTATTVDPLHTYTQPGTYTVSLTTIDATGCTFTSFVIVTIGSTSCQASFIYYIDSTNNLNYHFISTSVGTGLTYVWDFGDGVTATTADPYHTYAQNGIYMVCLSILGTNCQDIICDTVVVGNNTNPCYHYASYQNQGLHVFFNCYVTGGVPPYTFFWQFGDGATATTQDPIHVYGGPGSYTVTVTTTDSNGCSFTSTMVVTVTVQTTFDLLGRVFAGNDFLDLGTAELYAVTPSGAYSLVASCPIDSLGYYVFSFIPAGTYLIKATPSPLSTFFGIYLPTYYPHNTLWSYATEVVIGPVSNPYNIHLEHIVSPIQGNGDISGIVTEGYKIAKSGTPVANAEVILQSGTGACQQYVFTNTAGEFSFSSLGYETYKVYTEVAGLTTIPAVITLNSTNPVVNNVSVIITPSGITTGFGEMPVNEITALTAVYPNPVNSDFTVELQSGRTQEAVITIYDLQGRQLVTHIIDLTRGANKMVLTREGLSSGSYLMKIFTTEGVGFQQKLTIIK